MTHEIDGHIIDIFTGEIKKNQVLLIEQGIITDIQSRSSVKNRYLLPGLIDAHVHTVLEPSPHYPPFDPKESSATRLKRMRRNVKSSLAVGITTVRDCGHPSQEIFTLREDIQKHPTKGSRIITCGPLITTPKGHGRELGVEVRGVLAMEKACLSVLKQGADFIKLINNDPDGFSVEEMRAAIKIAHAHHVKVACHLYQHDVLERAIKAGVDMIEHFTEATETDVQKIKNQGIIVTPTYAGALDGLNNPEANVIGDEDIEEEISTGGFAAWIPQLKQGIKLLIKNGNTMATGSDAGFLHTDFQTTLREIKALQELGATPLAALQAATIHAAAALDRKDSLGSLEVGKFADVVAYKENPLENVNTLQKPLAIFREGQSVEISSL